VHFCGFPSKQYFIHVHIHFFIYNIFLINKDYYKQGLLVTEAYHKQGLLVTEAYHKQGLLVTEAYHEILIVH